MKKFLQLIAYYLAPLTALAVLVIFPERELLNYSGYVALYTIVLILFIKPIGIILNWRILKRLILLRREMGVFSFWAALLHGVGYLIRANFDLDLKISSPFLWGYIALFLIILLGITSNNISVRILRLNWKRLQYLAYPALVVAMLHVELVKMRTFYITLSLTALFIILKIWEKKKLSYRKEIVETEDPE